MPVSGRFALAAALCSFLSAVAGALEITACADGPAPGRKDFTLSGVMVLCGVGVHAGLGAGGRAVALSDPSGWRGLRILDSKFAQKLLAAHGGGLPAAALPGRQPELKVLSASPLNSNFRIANVEIAFDGELLAVFGVVRRRGLGMDVYSVVTPDFLVLQDEELGDRVRKLALDAGKRALQKT